MYGQTEATARMSFLPPEKLNEKMGSVGIAIKNGKFETDIVTGELLYTGPNVFGGYAENASDLTSYIQPEFLKTGDLARIDDEGYVYITGRNKRMIKITGNRLNLDEIESILSKEFQGIHFGAAGIADKTLVIAYNRGSVKAEAVKEYLRMHLGVHPAFVKCIFLEQFPLTANGKPDYRSILELAGN